MFISKPTDVGVYHAIEHNQFPVDCSMSAEYVNVNQALTHPIYFLMKPAAMAASFPGLVRVSMSIANNLPRHNSFLPLVTYWGQGEMATMLQIAFWNQHFEC